MTRFSQDEAGFREASIVYPCGRCSFWVAPTETAGQISAEKPTFGERKPGQVGDCLAIENTPSPIAYEATCALWRWQSSPLARQFGVPSKEKPPPYAVLRFLGLARWPIARIYALLPIRRRPTG